MFFPENELQPTTFALLIHGSYALPESAGPAVGVNRVVVYNLGAIEARPTIADAAPLRTAFDRKVQITGGAENKFLFDFAK
jgi:hypothetical protein